MSFLLLGRFPGSERPRDGTLSEWETHSERALAPSLQRGLCDASMPTDSFWLACALAFGLSPPIGYNGVRRNCTGFPDLFLC